MFHRDISRDIVLKTSHNIAVKSKARFLTCIFEKKLSNNKIYIWKKENIYTT